MARTAIRERLNKKSKKTHSGCIEWLGTRDRDGYARIMLGSRGVLAHREVYKIYIGEIPEGFTIDHLCNNRCCINPEHLEAVTFDENQRRAKNRRTHCHNGHPINAQNRYQAPDGRRGCRACNRAAAKRYKAKKREDA